MSCHAHCCAIDTTFDTRVASRDLARYRKRGPSPSTARLLAAIRDAGIASTTVLDVGGGVGAIAHELLDAGAATATVVDASTAYLAAARAEAQRRGTAARLATTHADFVAVAGDQPDADVVTLDKVVCCYPDMKPLLATSTARARRLYGIVYPRDRRLVRAATAAQNGMRRLFRKPFRVYVFGNDAIDAAIRRADFTLRSQSRDLVWVAALYERRADRP